MAEARLDVTRGCGKSDVEIFGWSQALRKKTQKIVEVPRSEVPQGVGVRGPTFHKTREKWAAQF
jgi:predicted Fe-S protein YdhL (DUF1289 family)